MLQVERYRRRIPLVSRMEGKGAGAPVEHLLQRALQLAIQVLRDLFARDEPIAEEDAAERLRRLLRVGAPPRQGGVQARAWQHARLDQRFTDALDAGCGRVD